MKLAVLAVLTALGAIAALALRSPPAPAPSPSPAVVASGGLRISAQLDRRYLPQGGGEAFLQVDVAADGATERGARVPVNAVLVLDRSGSMTGEKLLRAQDAARALVQALNGEDRLAIVDFASDAHLAFASAPLTPDARDRALSAIDALTATTGTNLSAALELAAPQLAAGRGGARIDKLFIASDGQANEGVSERGALLRLAADLARGATVSTFGVGADHDEELLSALAIQGGGRARWIRAASELEPALRAELTRATRAVARNVRLSVSGAGGATPVRVLGFGDGGEARLPDFAAGEERRVLVKLAVPAGSGEATLAQIKVDFEEAAGAQRSVQTAVGAVRTADARLLDQPATEAAVNGARAELADLSSRALSAFDEGRAQDAQRMRTQLKEVALRAAKAAPAQAGALDAEAAEWDQGVASGVVSGEARKAVKQKAFDAAAAPKAGW